MRTKSSTEPRGHAAALPVGVPRPSKLGVLITAAVAAGASPAAAQPAGAQAESLFRQGKDLMAKGKFAEACAAFDASQKLDPAVSTLLNQASCREKNGQLATAWGLFVEAERRTRAATDEPTRKLHQVAANHAARLEPRLSTLAIVVPPENRVGGLQVRRNTEVLDPGAWSRALPIDGGTYKITASAPGNADWSTTITIASERDAKTLEVPRLKAAALDPALAAKPAAPPAQADAVEAPRSRLVPFVLGGAALALGGAALGFELSARSTYDRALGEIDNPRQESLWQSANRRRHIAQGLGAAGVVSAGVAVWLYLRRGDEAPAGAASALQIVPAIDPTQAGLVVLGRY